MYNTHFQLYVDLPLCAIVLSALLLHFRQWAHNETDDLRTILMSRLLRAQVKASLFVGAMLFVCWYLDISFWIAIAIVLGLGMIAAFAGIDVAAMPILAAGFMLREWAFGFPSLVLHSLPSSGLDTSFDPRLIGVEATALGPLRPFGRIQFDDQIAEAVSESGQMIDSGARVRIAGCRNGVLQVQTVTE